MRDVALIKIIGDMDIDCDYDYSYYSPHFCYNELCYSIFLLLFFSKTKGELKKDFSLRITREEI